MTSDQRAELIKELNRTADTLSTLESEREELKTLFSPSFQLKNKRSSLPGTRISAVMLAAYDAEIEAATNTIRSLADRLAGNVTEELQEPAQ